MWRYKTDSFFFLSECKNVCSIYLNVSVGKQNLYILHTNFSYFTKIALNVWHKMTKNSTKFAKILPNLQTFDQIWNDVTN